MAKRGALSLFRGSKRGLSPLIATVLLIAFAVAMGAMIMNWSSSIGETEGPPDCSGINILANPVICYAKNAIQFKIKNEGSGVEELKLKIADENTDTDINLKNSKLSSGDTIDREIPFAKSGAASIKVYASIQSKGKLKECDTPAIAVDLKDCEV